MATAADSSSSSNSPRFRRNGRNTSPPRSHMVRREHDANLGPAAVPPSPTAAAAAAAPPLEPSDRSPLKTAASDDHAEVTPAVADGAPHLPPPLSDGTDQGGSGDASTLSREKKIAWGRPSNAVVEAGAVMGAVSWPALSEATKSPSKSASYDSLKSLSNGSVPASPAPVTTSPPPKLAFDNANSSSSTNHAAPIQKKSIKRGGGGTADSTITNNSGGAVANGGPVLPILHQTSAEVYHNTLDKLVTSEPSPRELTARSSNWDHGSRVGGFSPQSHGGNEHHKTYGGSRRGHNSGGGGGHHHNNFGNRPDQGQERGSYDWNRRSFSGGRDVQLQQQQQQHPRAMSRPFLRPPPPGSAPFIAPPPPVPPFTNPISYSDIHSPLFYVPPPPPPESIRGIPFAASPAIFFQPTELQLRAILLKQIDYYFSSENLCKDVYLRQNMDEEGWVSISLIAGFNRVQKLTNNIQFILDTVRTSSIIEVQGDKLRRRNDWKNWPPLTPAPNPPESPTMQNYNALAAHLAYIRMEEGSTSQGSKRGLARTDVALSRSLSGDLNSQSRVAAPAGGGSGQNGSDRSASARCFDRSDTF